LSSFVGLPFTRVRRNPPWKPSTHAGKPGFRFTESVAIGLDGAEPAPTEQAGQEQEDRSMSPLKKLWLSLAAALAVTAGTAQAQVVSIVTTPAGTFTNSSGAAIAKTLIDHAGLRVVVQAQAANGLNAVAGATATMGLSNSFDTTFFSNGAEYYADEGPHRNLRIVAPLVPYQVGMFVRADSSIKTVADLKGKRVSSGFNAQKTIASIIAAQLGNGGLTYKDVQEVPAPNVAREAEDFTSGKVDVLFFAIDSAAVKQAAATVGGLRALPLDTAPEAMARMQAVLPGSYVVTVNPAPGRDGIAKPTNLLAFDMVLYTNDQLPEDTIYRATKALYENKKDLAQTFVGFADFDPKHMATPVKDVPFHPGALKFYKEAGIAPAGS
jgi:uncharacterized protein